MIAGIRIRLCSAGVNELPLRGLLFDPGRSQSELLAIRSSLRSDVNVDLIT